MLSPKLPPHDSLLWGMWRGWIGSTLSPFSSHQNRGLAVVYMLCERSSHFCEPSSHYSKIMTGSDRMPVLIDERI